MVVTRIVDQRLGPPAAEEAVRRLERLTDRAPWPDAVDIDCAFHMALVASIDSPRLTRIYRSLQGEIRLALLQLGPAHQSATWTATEHRKVFTAIVEGPRRRALDERPDTLTVPSPTSSRPDDQNLSAPVGCHGHRIESPTSRARSLNADFSLTALA